MRRTRSTLIDEGLAAQLLRARQRCRELRFHARPRAAHAVRGAEPAAPGTAPPADRGDDGAGLRRRARCRPRRGDRAALPSERIVARGAERGVAYSLVAAERAEAECSVRRGRGVPPTSRWHSVMLARPSSPTRPRPPRVGTHVESRPRRSGGDRYRSRSGRSRRPRATTQPPTSSPMRQTRCGWQRRRGVPGRSPRQG